MHNTIQHNHTNISKQLTGENDTCKFVSITLCHAALFVGDEDSEYNMPGGRIRPRATVASSNQIVGHR